MASRFLMPYSSTRNWMQDPLFQLQREIDRVFEDVFSGSGSASASAGGRSGSMMNAPRIDLQDSEGELRLHADLPGVQASDLDIRVEGDVLTIRGERKAESERNEQNFHVMERSHGRFQRSIQLPFAPDPDEVQASVREGVLEVRIPKRAPQERSRRIEIRSESVAGRPMTAAVAGGGSAGSSSGSGASTGAGTSAGQGASGSASITPKGEADSGARSGSGTAGSGASSEGAMAGASGGPATAGGGTATKR